MMKNFKFLIVLVLFFNILNVFCDSNPETNDNSPVKPKPKPKPGNSGDNNSGEGSNDEDFNYCAYYGLTEGEQCGTYGYEDFSFCYVDVNNDPYCMLSVLCGATASCTVNSDCPTGYVCSPVCGSTLCEPLCGTTDAPLDPQYPDAPYYNLDDNRCFGKEDVPLESTPVENLNELYGTSYYSVVKSQSQSEEISQSQSSKSFLLSHLNIAVFSALVVVVVVGTFAIVYSSRLSSQSSFQELSTMESVDRVVISKDLELEPTSSKRDNGQVRL